ncbi:MAG: AAA family ATPase [Cyanobacteriota bacterium]|nr:AAA family ATPase [Cyanobacteriota bacterium]
MTLLNEQDETQLLLGDSPNSSQLKSFAINGLFGFKDITIPFEKEALILIAENGAGKTTILNALYYAISCKFHKLSSVDFESIVLEFSSGESVEIKKTDLKWLYERGGFEIITDLPSRELDRLQRESRKYLSSELFRSSFFHYSTHGIVSSQNIRTLAESSKLTDEEAEDRRSKIKETIDRNINELILYFPTYRRIEEDLKSLGYAEDEVEELDFDGEGKLIQFGMDDVIARLEEIKTEIKNSALNLFSKATGEILTQFVEGVEITEEMRNSIQPDTISIVLRRVGENNISKSDREKIEELVSSGEINSKEYEQLVYFLSKLVNLYQRQKEKDESINQFAQICNQYLSKKQIIYDEANIDISIRTEGGQEIDIRNLSSGEKQIISLFSKIYLESSEDFILLFDEPELSLSIEWQRLLLPDILKSGRCKLLLAVTHSPFIFDNELDLNARDLDEFVRER